MLSVCSLSPIYNCMTYKDRCAQSLISYSTLHRYRLYMDNVLLSFFALLATWLHALPSGSGWFMRDIPVFSWLVWLHLSGTQSAKTIKIHTCTGLRVRWSAGTAWGSRWSEAFSTAQNGHGWLIDWCSVSFHFNTGFVFWFGVANA